MLHPHTELRFISDSIGMGVVATKLIPKGTVTWVLDDLDVIIPAKKFERLGEIYMPTLTKYSYRDENGDYVFCWDNSRFINHSCDATCLAGGYHFEIAVRDIQPGEQLTDEYGTLNPTSSMDCHCGSKKCRGAVRPTDLENFSDQWDAAFSSAFPLIKKVAQPLWEMVTERDLVEKALRGGPKAVLSSRMLSTKRHVRSAEPLAVRQALNA